MVEHSLDKVSGHKHLFGKNIQQLVVDHQVFLHAELRHLLQSGIDKLHMTTPPHVRLYEDVHHFVKCGLGSRLFVHPLKQVIVGDQRLVPLLVVLIDELCGYWSILDTCWAAVETPQHLQVKTCYLHGALHFRNTMYILSSCLCSSTQRCEPG